MYYTGLDPRDMKPVYVPRTPHEKAMQRALLQFKNPANYELVSEALRLCGRDDLIGFHPRALIPPRRMSGAPRYGNTDRRRTEPRRNSPADKRGRRK